MEELEYPFFFTWVKQKNPLRFSISSVDGVKIITDTGHELIDTVSYTHLTLPTKA